MNLITSKISVTLTLLVVFIALFTASIIGAVSFQRTYSDLLSAAENKLLALAESREAALQDYLEAIRQDLRLVASNGNTVKALRDFKQAWQTQGVDATTELQRSYIYENPHPNGAKDELDFASSGFDYDDVHRRYHPWFRQLLREKGYYDIFLFSSDGDLIYTVFKERDYATNMASGQWQHTDLAKAFRSATDQVSSEFQVFLDFKQYEPSNGAPASFISMPVFNEAGLLIGVIAFQMPIGHINQIMQVSAGMGDTGETYIVGQDLLMRTDSRFSESSTILKTRVDTPTVKKALAGETGAELGPGYRGIQVLSAYRPLNFMGARWAIMAEIDEAEVLQPVYRTGVYMFIITGLVAFIAMMAGIFFSLRISRPIQSMAAVFRGLSANDLKIDIPSLNRSDEIGELAKSANIFKENTQKLHDSEMQFRTLVSNIPGAVFRYTDKDGRWKMAIISDEIENISGYAASDFIADGGRDFHDIIHPDDTDMVMKELSDAELTHRSYEIEYRIIHVSGDERWVHEKGQPIYEQNDQPMYLDGTIMDVTQRRVAEDKTRHMANHDELTGLPTLRLGKDRIAGAIALAHRYQSHIAVMFLDLDGFKAVNDTLGHDAGDFVLKEVAQKLQCSVREIDTVARIGGDEFIIVLTQLEEKEFSHKVAEKIIKAVTETIVFEDKDINIGASIGIAFFPDDGETAAILIKKADEAMYSVKHSGKNNYADA